MGHPLLRTMVFWHDAKIRADFPELAAGVVLAAGITSDADVTEAVTRLWARADERLAGGSEAELPEIQAWRRAFARMGLKPTQYRCASESLLRRYKKERSLPSIHPLVDLCNALSMAYAIPVAVLDADQVDWPLQVRYADGTETYQAFSGETEQPRPGEVVFADAGGSAHARRWTNRQSAGSAVRPGTSTVLIVAEAMHESAAADVARLIEEISAAVAAAWPARPRPAMLTAQQPRFEAAPEGGQGTRSATPTWPRGGCGCSARYSGRRHERCWPRRRRWPAGRRGWPTTWAAAPAIRRRWCRRSPGPRARWAWTARPRTSSGPGRERRGRWSLAGGTSASCRSRPGPRT